MGQGESLEGNKKIYILSRMKIQHTKTCGTL